MFKVERGRSSVRQDGRKKAIRQRAHTQQNKKQRPGDASFRLYPSRESTTQNVRAIRDCSRFVQAFYPSALHTRPPPMADPTHPAHTENRETGPTTPIPIPIPRNQPASFAVTKKHTAANNNTRSIRVRPSTRPSVQPTQEASLQPGRSERR